MADNEDKEVVALEQNVGKVTIEDRGVAVKNEGEEKEGGGVMGFFKNVGETIGGLFSWGAPDADIAGFHIPVINTKRAEIIIDVLITNPNPVPIPLVDMIYEISSDGRKLCAGTIPDAGTVYAHGSETVKIPLTLIYKDIVNTFDDIEPGQVIPYLAKVTLLVDVPVIGRITIPLEKKGEIPIPHKPDVDLEKIDWDHLSLEQTSATLHLTLKNMNKFDIGINSFEYDLQIADVSIGKASLKEGKEVKGEDVGTLEVPITFRPKDFGGALWDIMRGRGTGYTMVGAIEVDTPFGPMHLPFSKTSETTLKKKEDETRGGRATYTVEGLQPSGSSFSKYEHHALNMEIVDTDDLSQFFPGRTDFPVPDESKHLILEGFDYDRILTFVPTNNPTLGSPERLFLGKLRHVVKNSGPVVVASRSDDNEEENQPRVEDYVTRMCDVFFTETRLDDSLSLDMLPSRLRLRVGNRSIATYIDREGRKDNRVVWVLNESKHMSDSRYRGGLIQLIAGMIAGCEQNYMTMNYRIFPETMYGFNVRGYQVFIVCVKFTLGYIESVLSGLPDEPLRVLKYPSDVGLLLTDPSHRLKLLGIVAVLREYALNIDTSTYR